MEPALAKIYGLKTVISLDKTITGNIDNNIFEQHKTWATEVLSNVGVVDIKSKNIRDLLMSPFSDTDTRNSSQGISLGTLTPIILNDGNSILKLTNNVNQICPSDFNVFSSLKSLTFTLEKLLKDASWQSFSVPFPTDIEGTLIISSV